MPKKKKGKDRGKNWWATYPTAGGKRGGHYSTSKFWHRYKFRRNMVGLIFPKKLYPTTEHLPMERRIVDLFADLRNLER